MTSSIRFLIFKYLNFSIRIYDLKQMMISHRYLILLRQRKHNTPTEDLLGQKHSSIVHYESSTMTHILSHTVWLILSHTVWSIESGNIKSKVTSFNL